MSVFSMIRKGHKAAKEHTAKQAEKERKEQEKTPYRHVPRHAAIDALSGGPAGSRDDDRVKIVEHNKRRSVMTASGVGMGGMMTPVHQGMPRINSSLSYVSYPSAYASPIVQMPRAYSYTSVNPGWSHQNGEMSYTPLEHPSVLSTKGKDIERASPASNRESRSSSKGSSNRTPAEGSSKDGASSPVSLSGGSTSSQEDLEMKASRPAQEAPASATPKAPRPVSEAPDYFHRLHPSSHARRVSEPSQNPNYYPPQARASHAHYATRSVPLSRTSSSGTMQAGTPPVPSLPTLQPGSSLTLQEASSAGSSASSVTMVPAASSNSVVGKVSMAAEVAPEAVEYPLSAEPAARIGSAISAPAPIPATGLASSPDRRSRRLSKTTRFTELETIDSNISNLSASLDFGFSSSKETAELSRTPTAPSPTPSEGPAMFQQEYTTTSTAPAQKKGKLSKSAPRTMPPPVAVKTKPAKSNRWSFRSNKTAAVAS